MYFAEPEAPSNAQVVGSIVLLWQPPSKPNGVIIEYQIRVTYTLRADDVTMGPTIELPPDVFVYDLRTLDIPENVTATVEVSLKT